MPLPIHAIHKAIAAANTKFVMTDTKLVEVEMKRPHHKCFYASTKFEESNEQVEILYYLAERLRQEDIEVEGHFIIIKVKP
jgi:hypothetical protein